MNISTNLKLNTEDSFETAMKKLEEVVKVLEKGNLTLDETLEFYEEGIRLYRFCNHKLDKTEQKIKMLTEEEFCYDCIDVNDVEEE